MDYVKRIGVYKYADRKEALKANGGKKPIRVRWVDTDKGDRYRPRLVAMEFRKANETYFAGTPPLESLRVLCKIFESMGEQLCRPS